MNHIGLTIPEQAVLMLLVDAYNQFVRLPYSVAEQKDFANAIHQAQSLVALRVARRANPEVWSNAEIGG